MIGERIAARSNDQSRSHAARARQGRADGERGEQDGPADGRSLRHSRGRCYPGPVESSAGLTGTNYSSGDDYVVEFLGYRFSFNAPTSSSA